MEDALLEDDEAILVFTSSELEALAEIEKECLSLNVDENEKPEKRQKVNQKYKAFLMTIK